MTRLSLTALPAALALSLAFTSPLGTEIALAPEDGLTIVKTGGFAFEMELEEFELVINGEKMELDRTPEATNASSGQMVVTDTYDAVDGGRVMKLTRTFDELSQHESSTGGPDGDVDTDEESDLEGLTVVFTYDEDEEEYTAKFAEDSSDADEDLLVDLEQSIDFEGLLPDGEVDVDDSWTVDAAGFNDIFAFGGDLKFGEDEEQGAAADLIDEALEDNLGGEINCTFGGMRDVDGRELAVILIAVEAEGEAESEETEDTGESGFEMQIARTANVQLDMEGELLWDVEAGHFASLELSGEIQLELVEVGTGDFGGGDFEQEVTITFGGELSFEFTAE